MQTLFVRDGRRFREATPEEIWAVAGKTAGERRKVKRGAWSNMSPEQRSQQARKMAAARWDKRHAE